MRSATCNYDNLSRQASEEYRHRRGMGKEEDCLQVKLIGGSSKQKAAGQLQFIEATKKT